MEPNANNDDNPKQASMNGERLEQGIPALEGENPDDDKQEQEQGDENQEYHPLPNFPENQKFPNIRGEKTIVCWNCLTVLMVKEEWTVVKCTNCEKINRVPGTENNIDSMIRLNDNMNHFDVFVPYVYAIITCPFCQAENKIRKDAEHIVCFECHNSYNLQRDNKWTNPDNKPKQDGEVPFPDKPVLPPHDGCEATHKLLKKLIKQLSKQPQPPRPRPVRPDRYGPLRQLVRDVDEIGGKREMKRNYPRTPYFPHNVVPNNNHDDPIDHYNLPLGMSMGEKKSPLTTTMPMNIPMPKREKDYTFEVPMQLTKDFMSIGNEMEDLKRRLYAEIRSDPKYQDKYDNHKYNDNFRKGRRDNYNPNHNGNSCNYPTGNGNKSTNAYSSYPNTNDKKDRYDAVYKTMFTPIQKKNHEIGKIYGGLDFKEIN